MQYFIAHWKGQLSLAKSFLLNGLLAYLVLIICLVALGTVLTSQVFVFLGLAIFSVWAVWASVGIVRCSLRLLSSSDTGAVIRVLAGLAIWIVVISVGYAAYDLWRLLQAVHH